jgi:LmbE family N-acetylglucosaminyl deacetylase
MDEKVMVVAAHPDDETLGCGGSLLRHKESECEIYWLLVTNIHTQDGWPKKSVRARQNEIQLVSEMYDFKRTFKLDYPATRLDTVSFKELVSNFSNIFNEVEPSSIYVPNRSDIHTDHQVTFKAVMSCCKNFRSPFIKRILMYECISETEFAPSFTKDAFVPNVFVDISDYLMRKLEIFQIYTSEVMEPPFPRSVEAVTSLARYRGSRIGREFAESFYLIFEEVA